jgi:hypothetical protein
VPTIVILVCAASAGIHVALAPEHFGEGFAAGAGFALASAGLALIAVALSTRPTSVLGTASAALVLGGLLASYATAATTGVPAVHPDVEPVSGLALATKAIEVVGLVAAVSLLRRLDPVPQPKGVLR